MSRRKRKPKRKHTPQTKKTRKLTPKQRWCYGALFLFVFGLTLIPYIIDLIRNPDTGNAFLLMAGVVICVGATTLAMKYETL